MKIAVFADLHGRIFLCLKLVERLQRERNIKIDLILQCGDVGIFPNLHKLDKATLQHARRDPTELGFYRYFIKPQHQLKRLFKKLACDLVCVRGNHEDHEFLNQLEAQSQAPRFAVDCYQRIFICKTGELQTFQVGDACINIVGIGRIGLPAHKNPSENQKYIQAYEKVALEKLKKNSKVSQEGVDILITHDSPRDFEEKGFGMPEINDFLMLHKPLFHFYGHTNTAFHLQYFDNNVTQTCKIAELTWGKCTVLPEGCLVLIDWLNMFDNKIEVINDDWLKEYTRYGWEYL